MRQRGCWTTGTTPVAARVEEPKRREYDEYSTNQLPFSSSPESVSISDILTHCIGKRRDTWTQADKNRDRATAIPAQRRGKSGSNGLP